MPRNGSGVYSHPFPDVVEGTTIESAVFNGNTSDVEQDLNTPRPIVAGGTGANNAHDAMIALSGEIAGQVVTNYDTFPFVDGSFYSASGATAAPSADFWAGTCAGAITGSPVLVARCITNSGRTGAMVRRKIGGTWGAWEPQAGTTADLDAAYVNVTGDVMTGDLSISKASPGLGLHKTASGQPATLVGSLNGVVRWQLRLGNDEGESGSNLGSSFDILRFNDAGGFAGSAINIKRSGGEVTVGSTVASSNAGTGALVVTGGVGVGGSVNAGATISAAGGDLILYGLAGTANAGAVHFGTGGGNYLYWNGTGFSLNGGPLNVNSVANSAINGNLNVGIGVTIGDGVTSGAGVLNINGIAGAAGGAFQQWKKAGINKWAVGYRSSITGSGTSDDFIFYNNAIGETLSLNASNNQAVFGANVIAPFHVCTSNLNCYLTSTAGLATLQWTVGYSIQHNVATGLMSFILNSAAWSTWNFNGDFTHNGNAYKPGGGAWGATSDARIKNEIGDYTRGLDDVIALRPVYYTYKGNDTMEAPANLKEGDDAPLAVPYPNSPHTHVATSAQKFAGLIAQEVEAVFPEMVTKQSGYIDGAAVEDLRSLDTTPLIFAMINAIRELKAEIDVLKGTAQSKARR